MELKLYKRPKNVTIIEGFPGFGLIGTITTEFLIDHLDVELIGRVEITEIPAVVAIHDDHIVEPLGIFYNKKHNLIILHAVSASTNIEWNICDVIKKLSKELNAKSIISLEGVGSSATRNDSNRIFFFSKNSKSDKKMKEIGLSELKEGIIMGVTGALLLNLEKIPLICIFAETNSTLPDSKAAARIITALDKFLGLKVDPKPLLKQAEKFEEKLKELLKQGQQAQSLSDKKRLSYVG